MSVILEVDFNNYLTERKVIISAISTLPTLKKSSIEYSVKLLIKGVSGNHYKLIIRRSINYLNNFSITFLLDRGKKDAVNLTRYNGDWHRHFNKIEKQYINGFHIHKITERYQQHGLKPEGYAVVARNYNDWKGAYKRMLNDLNITTRKNLGQAKITQKKYP